jgi:hypothetical protein
LYYPVNTINVKYWPIEHYNTKNQYILGLNYDNPKRFMVSNKARKSLGIKKVPNGHKILKEIHRIESKQYRIVGNVKLSE